MGPQFGDIDAERKIREKWARCKVEYWLSNDPDVLSTMEDLIEADSGLEYNTDRAEWALAVLQTYGFPRHPLGILLITVKENGDVTVAIE